MMGWFGTEVPLVKYNEFTLSPMIPAVKCSATPAASFDDVFALAGLGSLQAGVLVIPITELKG
jgi:hypothetical protein